MFDRSTIVGLIVGVAVIAWAIILGPTESAFVDLPSMMIVFGGTIATTLIKFPLRTVLSTFQVARHAFVEKIPPPVQLVQALSRLAEAVRRDSLLAMEKVPVQDPFLRRAIDLCMEGTAPEAIEGALRVEVAAVLERHERGQRIFKGMGQSAPAFGMIGTLIGLVQMLRNMDDPSKIGPSMAVAVLTTFYGAVTAYLIFNPIADKLLERSRAEMLNREIVIQGILGILSGHHPRMVERRLHGLLEPAALPGMTVRRAATQRLRAIA